MAFPEIDPVLVSIGPLPIRWYALAYVAGLVLGLVYINRLLARPDLWSPASPPLDRKKLDDLFTWIILGVLLGGRIGFVVFYRPELLTVPPGEWSRLGGLLPVPPASALWEGGMSFHGGLLGVSVATWLFARRRETDAFRIGDLLACAAPIGLFFGRLANFINGELYGRPTDGPFGMVFPSYFDHQSDEWVYAADAVARHPSQLYEATLEGLVLFAVLFVLVRRARLLAKRGAAIGVFLAGYGTARFIVEFFREPDTYDFAGPIGFLTRGMMLSLPMIALGVFLIVRAQRKERVPA